MTTDTELIRFAQALMRQVRDNAIAECDRLASGAMVGPSGERWRRLVVDEKMREAVAAIVPDVVDQVLFELLNGIDNAEIPLGWQRGDGTFAALEELGREKRRAG